MGQSHLIVNLDKRETLSPRRFGEGRKLSEFGCSSGGTMTALALLLTHSNGRGGGDFGVKHPLVGSWSGNRVVIAGDAREDAEFLDEHDKQTYLDDHHEPVRNLHDFALGYFADISDAVLEAMSEDTYLRRDLEARITTRFEVGPNIKHALVRKFTGKNLPKKVVAK